MLVALARMRTGAPLRLSGGVCLAESRKDEMKTHLLKVDDAKVVMDLHRGFKTFEFRVNDRGFEVGHVLILRGWQEGRYWGKPAVRVITSIMHGTPRYGVPEGYCVMSLALPTEETWGLLALAFAELSQGVPA